MLVFALQSHGDSDIYCPNFPPSPIHGPNAPANLDLNEQ